MRTLLGIDNSDTRSTQKKKYLYHPCKDGMDSDKSYVYSVLYERYALVSDYKAPEVKQKKSHQAIILVLTRCDISEHVQQAMRQ